MRSSSLADIYLLGLGIRGMRQVSLETLAALRRCRIVLHLSDQHRALKRLHPRVVNLARFYWTGDEREEVYARLVRLILEEVARGPGVGVVTYGHPLLLDDVSLQLLAIARKRRLRAIALPAISCLDALSIDLGTDFGYGLQLFEASHLVASDLSMNPRIEALILQLGEFGESRTSDALRSRAGRFLPLENHLRKFYPPDHRLVIAFSDDAYIGRRLFKTTLSRLEASRGRIFPGSTLYLPAMGAE